MRWRNVLTVWAARRYRGRHRTGLAVGVIAAKLGDWDDAVTQIIPLPNVVRTPNVVPHRPVPVVLPRIIVPEPAPTPVSYWTTPVPMRAVAA